MGAKHFFDKLLPRHCVLCRSRCGANICPGCDADLPVIHAPCFRCGISMGLLETADDSTPHCRQLCGECISRPPPFHRTIAALDYAFPVTVLVQRFKFRRSFASGLVLSDRLSRAVEAMPGPSENQPDCLVPVPLHPARQFFRVFNQAEVLAIDVGKSLGIAVKPGLLQRIRQTRSQPGLTAVQRRRNLQGAITARPACAKHVALVDDVMTTGATVAECARALGKNGVEVVSVWIAARAQGG